jgi:hypothetical protein
MSNITDYEGRTIEIGKRVRICDFDPTHPDYDNPQSYYGIVTDLGEWDGDHDDEGRSISIPPYVTVLFEDGFKYKFITTEWDLSSCYDYKNGCWDEPENGKVEDIRVIGPPLVGSVKLRSS